MSGAEPRCGWWVFGEPPCICGLAPGHRGRHRCNCGSFWKGMGYPPPPPEQSPPNPTTGDEEPRR